MDRASMKVRDIAARTGATLRALHHYEQIVLLVPKLRNAADTEE